VLINHESSIGAILLTTLYLIYLVIILCISYYSCTCWVPTISLLNLAIFPCYSNLLLRRKRWTGILWWWVLGYALPRLMFLWCYGVFRCSALFHKRVILVFRDIWLSVNSFGPYVWNNLSWAHMQWVPGFGIKTRYDRSGTRAVSTIETLAYIEESFP
jgi:hypothetical protein